MKLETYIYTVMILHFLIHDPPPPPPPTHTHTHRLLVFGGALSALGLMTFLSVCLGYATMIIPRALTFYTCTALLALFGVKMLYEGWKMKPNETQEEFDEVSEELKKREDAVRCWEMHDIIYIILY